MAFIVDYFLNSSIIMGGLVLRPAMLAIAALAKQQQGCFTAAPTTHNRRGEERREENAVRESEKYVYIRPAIQHLSLSRLCRGRTVVHNSRCCGQGGHKTCILNMSAPSHMS